MKIKTLLTIGLIAVVISSCLKTEDEFGWEADKGQVLTGIYDRATSGETKPFVLNLTPTVETIDFLVIKTTAAREVQPSGDITATVVIDNSLVAAYNTKKRAEAAAATPPTTWTDLVPLPANAFTIPSMTATVPANVATNKREVIIPMTINKANLNLSNQYAIGMRLTTVSEGQINVLEEEVIATFLVKNPYDGIYSYVSGNVVRYTAPGSPANDALSGPLTPSLPDVRFVTTGANTNLLQGLQWSGGGGVGGVDPVTVTTNATTNATITTSTTAVTMTNMAGLPNNYNPATKTFTLNFWWNPTSTTREYSVVFRYKGPR